MSYASLLIHSCIIQRYSQVSIVVGTDSLDYYCILAHTAAVADKPITGGNYTTYWYPTGGSGVGVAWVLGTVYAASVDGYGNPVLTWTDRTFDCRLTAGTGREIKVGAEIVVADYKLFVESIDIIEQDKVVIGGLTYEVLLVQDYSDDAVSHHKQCWLRISR